MSIQIREIFAIDKNLFIWKWIILVDLLEFPIYLLPGNIASINLDTFEHNTQQTEVGPMTFHKSFYSQRLCDG